MPAEIESGESAHETLLDELQGGGEHGDRAWIRWVALTAMILALFSSVGALLSVAVVAAAVAAASFAVVVAGCVWCVGSVRFGRLIG